MSAGGMVVQYPPSNTRFTIHFLRGACPDPFVMTKYIPGFGTISGQPERNWYPGFLLHQIHDCAGETQGFESPASSFAIPTLPFVAGCQYSSEWQRPPSTATIPDDYKKFVMTLGDSRGMGIDSLIRTGLKRKVVAMVGCQCAGGRISTLASSPGLNTPRRNPVIPALRPSPMAIGPRKSVRIDGSWLGYTMMEKVASHLQLFPGDPGSGIG
ncbi:hypothetical protein BD779DRAFT_1789915 [Infundibulicybe gibba]|nr:hypothetical protein BD779DRAFT_1789915 [Infundibulicybe gibba]